VGGPGNTQGRNYHYSIEKDVNFLAEIMINTDIRFVNLFKKHDKVLMNGARGV